MPHDYKRVMLEMAKEEDGAEKLAAAN